MDSYWDNLQKDVRAMKRKELGKLIFRMTEAGAAEFFKLYSTGFQDIHSDDAFEQAFDFVEEILRRENKDAATG